MFTYSLGVKYGIANAKSGYRLGYRPSKFRESWLREYALGFARGYRYASGVGGKPRA
jgi:hypothetical protein